MTDMKEWFTTMTEVEALRERVAGLEIDHYRQLNIIFALYDNDDCELDHEGYCQAHLGADDINGRCANAVAREMLKANGFIKD